MMTETIELYCGFARKHDLLSDEFNQLVDRLAAIDLGELHGLSGWLNHWSRRWEFPWCFAIVQQLLEQHAAPAKILESGCGVTPLPFWLAAHGHQVIGVDLDPTCADAWASSKVPCRPDPAQTQFQIGDMENLPFDDGSFDLAYSVSAVEHTKRPDVAVRELCRVVKPGGGIVLTCDVDVQHSDSIASQTFLEIQAILQQTCSFAAPLSLCLPSEILTFENRTIQPQPSSTIALKHFLDKLGLKKRIDHCVYTFIGRKN